MAAEPIVNGNVAAPEDSPRSRVIRAFEAIRTGRGLVLTPVEAQELTDLLVHGEDLVMQAIRDVAVNCERKTVGLVKGAVERLKNPRSPPAGRPHEAVGINARWGRPTQPPRQPPLVGKVTADADNERDHG